MKTRGARLAAGLIGGLVFANPVSAQYAVGGGVDYLGYAFDAGLGAEAAQLFMVPVGIRLPVTPELSIDIFSAWAEGRVERDNQVLKLSGPVDTSVKAAYAVTPWALLSVGVNLPTGEASHTNEEAIVASVLSTDLLGFRETTWGTGMAVTSSVATAINRGGFGIGIAAAYAMRGKFEPSATDALEYQPGSETRVRVGLDRNIGNSTFMAGATFINYTQDQADGVNLFQAGNRLRFDASYAFRAGAGVWTIYGAELMRANGDLRLDIVDDVGALVGDTTVTTAKQNLIVGGVMGTVGLGGGFVFRPHVDFKYQSREEAPLEGETEGNPAGSGWMVAAGGDIPLRIFGTDFFPKARVYIGSIEDAVGGSVSTLGMEFKGNLRWSF